MSQEDGWSEWSKFVLSELERLNTNFEALRDGMTVMCTEIAVLKVKAGVWGAIGAAIPIVAMLLWQLFR